MTTTTVPPAEPADFFQNHMEEKMEFSNLNLQLFTPLMSPWIRALYTLALILGTIVAVHVQKVVLRTLGNLNKRHINIIIYPSLVMYQIHFKYLQVTFKSI